MQFRNKCKKTCTGTVIADNVVITAARCIVYGDTERTRSPINLDLSFVVIGTKKMHGLGREQYIPVKRIQFHPELKTRDVDLALVYTDAGIKTNRGGSIAKLIKNRVIENESEVTVVSWEPMSAKERKEKGLAQSTFVSNDEDAVRGQHFPIPSSSKFRQDMYLRAVSSRERGLLHSARNEEDQKPRLQNKKPDDVSKSDAYADSDTTIAEITEKYEKKQRHGLFKFSKYRRNLYDLGIVNKQSPNTLASASFMLLKPLMCRKFLERVRPKVYSRAEVMNMACFTSDTRCITDADLGSGVFHNGKLFAITVDHVELNLQYVGLALQVACFCPWLVRKGGNEIDCAPKCCIKEDDDLGQTENASRYVQTKPSFDIHKVVHGVTAHSDNHKGTQGHEITTVNFTSDFQAYGTYPHPSQGSAEYSTPLASIKDKIEVHGKENPESYKTHGKGQLESFRTPVEGYHELPKPSAKEHRGSNEAPEIGHYEPEAAGKDYPKIIAKHSYEPAELITLDASANVNPIDSPPPNKKRPKFKGQDDLFYGLPAFRDNMDDGIPYTMELLTSATDSTARAIDSRLVGLEEYLVD